MNIPMLFRSAVSLATSAVEFLFERLVRRPLRGAVEFIEGLALVVPDVAEASAAAVVQAVTGQLSAAGRARVRSGIDLLGSGLRQMAWLAGLAVALVVCQLPGGFWVAAAVAALFLLATIDSEPIASDCLGTPLRNGWGVVSPSQQ